MDRTDGVDGFQQELADGIVIADLLGCPAHCLQPDGPVMEILGIDQQEAGREM
ncbi:MAG TPA: hypothetical protein VF276_14545 [Chloroflexia bacterium]